MKKFLTAFLCFLFLHIGADNRIGLRYIESGGIGYDMGGNAIGALSMPPLPKPSGSALVTFANNQMTDGDAFSFFYYGDSPNTACLTTTGNTSTASPAYSFSQAGTGITPCDYATKNTGDFSLTGVTTETTCSGGSLCE